MLGVVEDSLAVQLDGILVFVDDDSVHDEFQAFKADFASAADNLRFSLLLRVIVGGTLGSVGWPTWLLLLLLLVVYQSLCRIRDGDREVVGVVLLW